MWKSFLCAFVTFLIAVTKHLKRSNVKEEGFLLAHGGRGAFHHSANSNRKPASHLHSESEHKQEVGLRSDAVRPTPQ